MLAMVRRETPDAPSIWAYDMPRPWNDLMRARRASCSAPLTKRARPDSRRYTSRRRLAASLTITSETQDRAGTRPVALGGEADELKGAFFVHVEKALLVAIQAEQVRPQPVKVDDSGGGQDIVPVGQVDDGLRRGEVPAVEPRAAGGEVDRPA